MEQFHHIHHNFPTKAGRLAGVFTKRHPSSLSKKVCSPPGPLCEGDSPQRGEMSRSDRGAWARRALPAGGGGENCTAVRNISGYGKVLSLRPFGAPPSQREVFRHAEEDAFAPSLDCRKRCAHPLAPSARGLRPQAVGERTYRQAAVYTTVTSVSQSPVTAYLPLPAGIK